MLCDLGVFREQRERPRLEGRPSQSSEKIGAKSMNVTMARVRTNAQWFSEVSSELAVNAAEDGLATWIMYT